MKAVIYARCSTDEIKQDVERQLSELRRYCQAYAWEFDEVFEYESSYKGKQVKLYEVLEKIRKKEYQVILVYSLDRFSRMHPRITDQLINQIVYDFDCRFIELQMGLDSTKELTWHVVRPMMQYFAWVYSRNLSQAVKGGIRNKKEKGEYHGGRPEKTIDLEILRDIYREEKSYRKAAEAYNQGRPKKEQISHVKARELLIKEVLS